MKRCFTVLSAILILVAVAAGGAGMMVEWAVGCGESWVDAKGTTHINDCVFIPTRHGRK